MRSAATPEPRRYSGLQRLARPSAARPGGGAPLTTTATSAWRCLTQTCGRNPLLRAGASLIDVRDFLGHASIKTTSIYLSSGPERQEAAVIAREQGRSTLDQDRDAA